MKSYYEMLSEAANNYGTKYDNWEKCLRDTANKYDADAELLIRYCRGCEPDTNEEYWWNKM